MMNTKGYKKIQDLGSISNRRHVSKQLIKESVTQDTYQQMIKESKPLFNRVNRRIRSIERNRQLISPAYNALREKRGPAPRFGTSISVHNLDDLQKEIALAREFDNLETSSVPGARAFTNNLKDKLNMKAVKKLDSRFINQVFDALHALHERMPDALYQNQLQYASYLDTIVEVSENGDISKLDDAEQVEILVTRAIDKLSTQVTDKINDDIDEVSRLFDTKLF